VRERKGKVFRRKKMAKAAKKTKKVKEEEEVEEEEDEDTDTEEEEDEEEDEDTEDEDEEADDEDEDEDEEEEEEDEEEEEPKPKKKDTRTPKQIKADKERMAKIRAARGEREPLDRIPGFNIPKKFKDLLVKVKKLKGVEISAKKSITTCFYKGVRFLGFTNDNVSNKKMQLFLNGSVGKKFKSLTKEMTYSYPNGTVGVIVTPETIDEAFEVVKEWYDMIVKGGAEAKSVNRKPKDDSEKPTKASKKSKKAAEVEEEDVEDADTDEDEDDEEEEEEQPKKKAAKPAKKAKVVEEEDDDEDEDDDDDDEDVDEDDEDEDEEEEEDEDEDDE